MKSLDPAILAARQSRGGVKARGLIWVTARNRSTGAAKSIGFWTGDDHQTFSIDGQGRTYYGAGNVLDLGDTVTEVGLTIRTRTVVLSGLTPEARQAFSVYDARLAPVEIHRAEFDPATDNLLAEPERIFKGWIDQIAWATGAKDDFGGATYTATLTVASASRALTRTLPQKFSDASQRLRDSGDSFFQYVDVSGDTYVFWGSKRAASSVVSAAPGNRLTALTQKAGAV